MNSAKLKMSARKNLQGKYTTIILSLLLLVLLIGGSYLVAKLIKAIWIAPILIIIVCSLFVMGFIGIVLKISRRKKVSFDDLFAKTDLFDKYIGLTVILLIIGLLAWVLEYLSFKSLIVIILYQMELNSLLAAVLIIFGILLSTAILLVSIYIAISFSQVYFILYDEPKLSIVKILDKSFDMMGNYIIEYFVLLLSFLGWIVLGLFTFGVLYIWLIPYMLVTLAKFYDIVKKDYEATSGNTEELKLDSAGAEQLVTKKTVKKNTATKRTNTKKTSTTRKTTTKKTGEK